MNRPLRDNRALFARENADSSRTKDDDEAKSRNLGSMGVAGYGCPAFADQEIEIDSLISLEHVIKK